MNDYSQLEFWENRYKEEAEKQDYIFEWYQVYSNIKEKLSEFLSKDDKILILGAGTSKLSEDMYYDEYKNITNLDFSATAVKKMEERYKINGIDIKYLVMDATDLKDIKNEEYKVVIDKGTLDSVLCGENSLPKCEKMITEVYRILSSGGVFICISYGDENNRKSFFSEDSWNYKLIPVEKPTKVVVLDEKDPKNFHYIYILNKK